MAAEHPWPRSGLNPFVIILKPRRSQNRRRDGFDKGPAKPLVALFGKPAMSQLGSRSVSRRDQSSITGTLLGFSKAMDIVYLIEDQYRESNCQCRYASEARKGLIFGRVLSLQSVRGGNALFHNVH